MSKYLLNIICYIILLSQFAAYSDDTAKELYFKSNKYMQEIKWTVNSYTEALNKYNSAEDLINNINSRYPGSDVNKGLMKGKLKIAGLTLKEFNKLGDKIRIFLKAESDQRYLAYAIAYRIKDKQIEEKLIKSFALAEVAESFCRVDSLNLSERLLWDAYEIASHIKNEFGTNTVLLRIASVFNKIDRDLVAHSILNEIYNFKENKYISHYSKKGEAELLASLGFFSKSTNIIDEIKESYEQAIAFVNIADSCSSIKEYKKANAFLQKAIISSGRIKDKYKQAKSMVNIGNSYRKIDIHKMKEIISRVPNMSDSIETEYERLKILLSVVKMYRNIGNREKAYEAVNNILNILEDSIHDSEDYKVRSISRKIAIELAIQGDYDHALDIVVEKLNETSYCTFFNMLSDSIESFQNSTQYQRAIKLVRSMKDKRDKYKALAMVTGISPKGMDTSLIENNLSEVYDSAFAIEDETSTQEVLRELSLARMKLGNVSDAVYAAESMAAISSDRAYFELYIEIISYLFKKGKIDSAIELVNDYAKKDVDKNKERGLEEYYYLLKEYRSVMLFMVVSYLIEEKGNLDGNKVSKICNKLFPLSEVIKWDDS